MQPPCIAPLPFMCFFSARKAQTICPASSRRE